MNLVIDIGNTATKTGVFDGNSPIKVFSYKTLELLHLSEIFSGNQIEKTIISSVTNLDKKILSFFKEWNKPFIILNENTKIPIVNLYKTPETLGYDRIASAVGANTIFPEGNVLVIDAGTAIKFDVVNQKGEFLGGTISPGLEMRFRALHEFTSRLPLLEKKDVEMILGDCTEFAIIAGVQNGMTFEIDGYIENISRTYSNLKVILTGGDAFFFEKKIKKPIFVEPNLVQIGLNAILNFQKNGSKKMGID